MKRISVICLIAIMITSSIGLSACGEAIKERNKPVGNLVGVIYTESESKDTRILVYDDQGNEIDTTKYKMASVGRFGFGSVQCRKGVMYEIANGYASAKNAGIVMCYDLSTGRIDEIKFGRSGMTDLKVTDKYLYVLSNINNNTFIDRYCFDTKEIKTFTLEGGVSTEFTVSENDKVYYIDLDYSLFSVDIDQKVNKEICKLESPSDYMFANDDNVYLSMSYGTSEMLVVNGVNGKTRSIDLNISESGMPYYQDGYLYVSSADPTQFSDSQEIVKLDLKDEKVVDKWDFNHGIMKYALIKDMLYTVDWDNNMLRIYDVSKKTASKPFLKCEVDMTDKKGDCFLSGMGIAKCGSDEMDKRIVPIEEPSKPDNEVSDTIEESKSDTEEIDSIEYDPAMSSIPGYPIIAFWDEETNRDNKVKLKCSQGEFIKWDRKTGKTHGLGKTHTYRPDEDIYWSPLVDQSFKDSTTIIATSIKGGR